MKKNIYLSKNAKRLLKQDFVDDGYNISLIKGCENVENTIRTHPDIYMCKLGITDESPVFFGDSDKLTSKYPGDIRYNAACSGKYFIHNLKYTDEKLLKTAESMGMILVNVAQGYTKCSTAIIDENSFITSDVGIADALRPLGADVLLIEKGHIKLPGYNYGFIGGTCVRIADNMIFNGNLSAHPDFPKIRDFVTSKGLWLIYYDKYELEDIGSMITAVDNTAIDNNVIGKIKYTEQETI